MWEGKWLYSALSIYLKLTYCVVFRQRDKDTARRELYIWFGSLKLFLTLIFNNHLLYDYNILTFIIIHSVAQQVEPVVVDVSSEG